jgi:hypothetical protein
MSRTQYAGSTAADIARRLAQDAEAVCRHYLSNGCRTGRYWHVGDIANTPGRSLYVHLSGERTGKWVDAATGEHGDLLDLIALNRNLASVREALQEARYFLELPRAPPAERLHSNASRGPSEAAKRLFASAQPIAGTIAQSYLKHRGIRLIQDLGALRFHPECFYRTHATAAPESRPALLAAVTDLGGRITGVERTWLAPSGSGKAPIPVPRRALGQLLGHGVRFGTARRVLLVGEGIETVLSLKSVMPAMPAVAALSATRLGNLALPVGLRRLYVACDLDPAGWRALDRLRTRSHVEGFRLLPLLPAQGDFNDDLCAFGPSSLRASLRAQMTPEDLVYLDERGPPNPSAL